MDSLFSQLNMGPNVFLVVGVLLALVGMLNIIKNGLSLAIWIVLLVVGVSSIHYGMKESGMQLSPEISAKLSSVVEPGKAVSQEALRSLLCAGGGGKEKPTAR